MTRRHQAQAWEAEADEDFWAGSAGRSAEHTAWEHSRACEWADAVGLEHVSVFMDMAKAYERIPHDELERQCQGQGYPDTSSGSA